MSSNGFEQGRGNGEKGKVHQSYMLKWASVPSLPDPNLYIKEKRRCKIMHRDGPFQPQVRGLIYVHSVTWST